MPCFVEERPPEVIVGFHPEAHLYNSSIRSEPTCRTEQARSWKRHFEDQCHTGCSAERHHAITETLGSIAG